MAKTIWKFPLKTEDNQVVEMPIRETPNVGDQSWQSGR